MAQRGRRSQASLNVGPLSPVQVRIAPPATVTSKPAKLLFASVVAANAHLRPADAVMLGLYVQAVMKTSTIAKKDDPESVRAWERCSRVAAMWATKLRLTVQSQVLPDAAGRTRSNKASPVSYYESGALDDDE